MAGLRRGDWPHSTAPALDFQGQRRSQACMRESSERAERAEAREERMAELLESTERELRQLNTR
ncbi:MAG TPA: hypothetical protein VJ739_12355 [Gemmataceae bacterium]|nr:hypothetical protein [Gemmataceae bacterium]